jgi:hypothetical protein
MPRDLPFLRAGYDRSRPPMTSGSRCRADQVRTRATTITAGSIPSGRGRCGAPVQRRERGILPPMKNPRVEGLNYEFRSLEDRHDFSQAAAWEGDLGGFRCRLDQGTLEARPRAHYANVDSARHALERHLRAWELWSELNNIIRVEFLYKSAQVVDRQSTPDSVSVAVDAEAAEVVVVANDATVKLGHGEYPAPPSMDLKGLGCWTDGAWWDPTPPQPVSDRTGIKALRFGFAGSSRGSGSSEQDPKTLPEEDDRLRHRR